VRVYIYCVYTQIYIYTRTHTHASGGINLAVKASNGGNIFFHTKSYSECMIEPSNTTVDVINILLC
jgi:hypothetical protein